MGKPQNKKHKSRIRARKARHKLGSREYKNYSDEMLELACESVASKQISSRDAERQFGIPRRTILNKIKNKHLKTVGHPTALSAAEEKSVVRVLQASSDFGSPLTKLDLKLVVHEYLKKNSREHLFKNQIPSDAWVQGFLARNADELCIRTTQNISRARGEKGPEEIAKYFENLTLTLENIPPENLINFDETNLSDDPGSSKGIFRRGIKYPERVVNSSKGNISLMFTATASGQCLPLYVVYKSLNLYTEWISGGPPKTRYNCTKSGWFDSAMFEDYFEKIILPWAQITPGTKVVICDNLSSHLSIKVVELCDQNDIKFVFIPPRSTHLTQPLDVAFFAPLKKAWRKILYNYKLKNPDQKSLNKKHFPKLLVELSEAIKLKEEKNIQSGFKASGIYPLNPQEVLKKIPEFQELILAYSVDQTLIDYLKETRSPRPMAVNRNKKVHCEPGKSVTSSDFNVPSNTVKTKNTSMKKRKVVQVNTNNTGLTYLDDQTGSFTEAGLEDIRQLVSEDAIDVTEAGLEDLVSEEAIDFMIPSLDDNTYFDEYIVADEENKSGTLILRCPDSLSLNCLHVINSSMNQSANNVTKLPEYVHDYAHVKASTSGNTDPFVAINKKVKTGAPKITIQSCKIVTPGIVSLLNKVSNTIENTSFAAMSENDLPECLTKVSKKIKGHKTSGILKEMRFCVKDKLKISVKEKKTAQKNATIIKKENQYSKTSLTTPGFLPDSVLPEYQAETNLFKKIKQEENKYKNQDMKEKKIKKAVAGKKSAPVFRKGKRKRQDSESSSISADSTFDLATADSDNSDYATLEDCYIAECLREQEEKENGIEVVLKNDIPFGINDIEYFNPDNNKLQEGNWVVVRFSTKNSTKHFVGKILSVTNGVPRVKFLRKVKESNCKEGTIFTYPTIDDVCSLPHVEDILTVLLEPKITRRGQLIFNADLKNFNIQ